MSDRGATWSVRTLAAYPLAVNDNGNGASRSGHPILDLAALCDGAPALTRALGTTLYEAASVCFSRWHSASATTIVVRGDHEASYGVSWVDADDQMRRAYNDDGVAVEQGAYGVAIALVRRLEDEVVIERSKKGTGFDYWLGDSDGEPFQRKARLEVSGLHDGSDSRIRSRVVQKRGQTTVSDRTRLPARVVVVQFKQPVAHYEVRR